MDKIIIKNLLVRGIIGINDWERKEKQDILVNVTMFTDISKAAETDSIDYCVNYRTAAKAIIAHCEQANRLTVEALAQDIADICLSQPLVLSAIVRVEKPGAVRFSESVGVEIERSNPRQN